MNAILPDTPPLAPPPAPPRAMRILHSELWVPASLADVWPFFSDAANLERLTPPFVGFRILTPQPIAMGVGARIRYRIKVHGVPLHWQTRIARWEPPHCFADEQEQGPYRLWVHTHSFLPLDGGTLLGDEVRFAVRGGHLAPLLSRLFVERDVLRIFRYRLTAIAQRFGGDAAQGRVWLERPAG